MSNSNWIPVEIDIPPSKKNVLWCGGRGRMFVGHMDYDNKKQELEFARSSGYFVVDLPTAGGTGKAIAWRELPAPYKRGKNYGK